MKDLGFSAEIILKCDNEPSTKSLQDLVIQACARVEVIPQGPPEGDHMAKSRRNGCERCEKTLRNSPNFERNKTRVNASQMAVRSSIGFLVSQRKS